MNEPTNNFTVKETLTSKELIHDSQVFEEEMDRILTIVDCLQSTRNKIGKLISLEEYHFD